MLNLEKSEMRPKLYEVLVIDNNAEDVSLLKESICKSRVNASVSVMNNGTEAMEFLRKKTNLPEIIYLEINLPDKSGHKVLSEIKADCVLKDIPVIIITASQKKEDLLSTHAMGIHAYIVKPENFTAYADAISYSNVSTTLS